MINIDRVSTRFFASANYLSGATEVVTVIELDKGVPTYKDIAQWIERNSILHTVPYVDDAGYLKMREEKYSGIISSDCLRISYASQLTLSKILEIELGEPVKHGLWRITLYHCGTKYFFAWRRNHLISDAFTTNLMLGDLFSRFTPISNGWSTWSNRIDDDPHITSSCSHRLVFSSRITEQLNNLCKSLQVSLSSIIAVLLRHHLANDSRKGKSIWVAYSRRKVLNNWYPGCLIGVVEVPISELCNNIEYIQKCEQYILTNSQDTKIQLEHYEKAKEGVKKTCYSSLGPCVTNNGRYRSLESYEVVRDIVTCVDRRQGNYSVVAHLDRFRGRVAMTLSSAAKVFSESELQIIAEEIINYLDHDKLILPIS
ncbi:hypothetical protein [Xenorhabdus anantnagensis]|uniref:Uncharacterized protein n=1 Tax=Xenorhabdus anantnagensis TaxID=3025875 RepID=A0ABT5LWI0_9GAMM|nr:hypothetical protein [Xenorhabdus anantnagensis]MDC9598796.1 hypothetical protein [Xenorhabdus anantnagensis]